jgi:hypothetical protein
VREPCVGCGAAVDVIDGPVHRYMTSAPGCWRRYGELLGVLLADPTLQTARIMCVDAYAAQHPGSPGPQAIQSVAGHLINLHEYLVRGRPVSVPRIHGGTRAFRWLQPPSFASSNTVFDVPVHAPAPAITTAARAWAESVWTAWWPHHAEVAAWHARYAAF